jgi:hypothetical protein
MMLRASNAALGISQGISNFDLEELIKAPSNSPDANFADLDTVSS